LLSAFPLVNKFLDVLRLRGLRRICYERLRESVLQERGITLCCSRNSALAAIDGLLGLVVRSRARGAMDSGHDEAWPSKDMSFLNGPAGVHIEE